MAEQQPVAVRSYQRIFAPDRRIYAIDGRPLPVPGGVPLRWLGYASAALLGVLILSGRSPLIMLLGAGVAARVAKPAGRLKMLGAAVGAAIGMAALGGVLGLMDWPLRLVIIPGLVATVATRATPDGRPAHRYVVSLVGLWAAPARRSLGRPLTSVAPRGRVGLGRDADGPVLRRARVVGPAGVHSLVALDVRRGLVRRQCLIARPAPADPQADPRYARARARKTSTVVWVEAGERLEVRP